jgi:hypothetical protein
VPGKELESVINDGIRPLVGDEVRGACDEADFHVIGIGSVILQHTIRQSRWECGVRSTEQQQRRRWQSNTPVVAAQNA